MKTLSIAETGTMNYLLEDFNDIIFEHRNKTYGAYLLRKSYDRNLMRGAFIATTLLLLGFNYPAIANLFGDNMSEKERMVEGIFTTTELPDIAPVTPPPPPKMEQPLRKSTIAFVAPVVRRDPEVVEEIPLPDQATLDSADISTKNLTGVADGISDGIFEDAPELPPQMADEEKPDEDNEVKKFFAVEQKPAFPDGDVALFKFLQHNLRYPAMAHENGIEGTVTVSFVVEKDGAITNVQVIRDIGGGCGQEAVRVVKLMPNWLPGKQRGRPVRVQFSLPVRFKLQ